MKHPLSPFWYVFWAVAAIAAVIAFKGIVDTKSAISDATLKRKLNWSEIALSLLVALLALFFYLQVRLTYWGY